MHNENLIPSTVPKDWYLQKGNNGPSQWFSEVSLEHVLAIAVLMTGSGAMSGADQVTLEDEKHHKIVTFISNEGHHGCSMVIPHDSTTTGEDLSRLKHLMVAYGHMVWLTDKKEEEEEPVEQAK